MNVKDFKISWLSGIIQKKMFNEHEVVRARRQLSEKVPQGARGTILLIHEHPTRAYEAEFIDEEGSTIDVLTVTDSDITRDLET